MKIALETVANIQIEFSIDSGDGMRDPWTYVCKQLFLFYILWLQGDTLVIIGVRLCVASIPRASIH